MLPLPIWTKPTSVPLTITLIKIKMKTTSKLPPFPQIPTGG